MNALITKQEELLRKNRKIDSELVLKFSEIEIKLRNVGVNIRKTYNLAPPLGFASTFFVCYDSEATE
jgi:hypothetical protein